MVAIAAPRTVSTPATLKVDGCPVIVDRGDYMYLSKFNWQLHDDGRQKLAYCISYTDLGYPKYIWMHRLVAARHGLMAREIGHKNGNSLDNRVANLLPVMQVAA